MKTLVLIPGLLCDGRLWSAQIEALKGCAEVAVADITRQATVAEMAKDVLDHAPARFSLAGFSLGSQVALAIMESAKDRVERLALLSATRGGLFPVARAAIDKAIETIEAGGFEDYLDAAYPTYFAAGNAGNAALRDSFMEMAHAVGPKAGLRQMRALLSIAEPFGGLDRISCPTVILGGSEDRRTPPSAHEALAAEIPGARLVMVEGAAHFTPLEQPERVSEALREWMAG